MSSTSLREDRRSRTKKLVHWGILALGLLLLLEVFSFAAFRIIDGAWFTYGRFDARRQAVIAEARDAETGTRAGTYQQNPLTAREALHPYLGFVLDRGLEFDFAGRHFSINEYGFVDARSPLQRRSPDKVIVGILGGSVAEIFHRAAGERLKADLRASPRFEGKEIVLVNLALRGYRQPQQLATLNYILALGGELDVIINIDGFNEMAFLPYNRSQGVATIYPNAWYLRASQFHDSEMGRLQGEVKFLRYLRAQWAEGLGHLSLSVTANMIWRVGDLVVQRVIAHRLKGILTHPPSEPSYAITGPRQDLPDESTEIDEMAAIWRRSSLQLDNLARANGALYFHFLQPNQYFPDSKPLSQEELQKAYSQTVLAYRMIPISYPVLQREGRELVSQGVEFHDLSMLFANVKETLYNDPCCHLNVRGNEMLADAIAGAIGQALAEEK